LANLILNGSTSGSVTLSSPAVSGTTTLTLPAQTGTVLTTNGSGIASVNGIQFPATQSASADANTLDDYEEGTWTPTDTSGAGLSFTGVIAKYTKVGKNVTLNCVFSFPSTASTANVSFGGIPFPVSTGMETCMAIWDNAGLGANQVYLSASSFDIRPAGSGALRTNVNFSLKAILLMASYTST
jgi:hypothetical protein